MIPGATPHFQLAATIPVLGEAAYRTARQKLQQALTALGIRETVRAQAVAEFSLLFRALNVGDTIELTLIGHAYQMELALQCPATADTAKRLGLQLHLLQRDRPDGGTTPGEPLRLSANLRAAASMDLARAEEWLLGTTTEELKLKATQTEEANAAKREFLSRMSHELRTPMNAIIGMTHLALRTDLDNRQRDYLQKIQSAGENLLGIINDVLDFSKIEAGKLSLENTDFRLDKILGDVTNLVAERVASKGVELLFSIDEQVPDELNGDPLRLTQILLNLLSNAAKFTEAGQITLRVSLLSRSPNAVELQFEVQDTGIGMSETQMANLFQAFSQADVSTTRRYGGTGLGLSICQRLLELMGGSISVTSRSGEGSCFRARARFGLGQRETGQVLPLALNQLPVLVVDDNPVACEVMATLLAHLPVRHRTASSGEQALQLIQQAAERQQPYRLILLDWQLGDGIDGLEVARLIRGELKLGDPKIVLISAHGRNDAEQLASAELVDACLSKPVRPSELVDTLVGLFAGEAQQGRRTTQAEQRPPGGGDGEEWNLQGVRVLLVEDNPINQQIACELLEIVGVNVSTACNGVEALQWLEAGTMQAEPGTAEPSDLATATTPCDLVLMDLNMPEMDGWECVRRIRRDNRWQGLPVLAMTAHAMQQERDRCLALGMQDHITKPIDPNHLYERLRHWSGREVAVRTSQPTDSTQQPEPRPIAAASTPTHQELLAALEGFDCGQALRRVAGNTALYVRLLRSLLDSQADAAERLGVALTQQDYQQAESIVHTLKGVAANLGATDLAEAAACLDAKLKQRSCPKRLRQRFETQLERTLQTLRQAFPEGTDDAVGTAMAPTQAALQPEQQELLETLEGFLISNDGEALELVDVQKASLVGILGSEMYNELAQQVQRFAFAAALAVLRRCPQADPSVLSSTPPQ